MKINALLFTIGIAGTFAYLQFKTVNTSNVQTVEVEKINSQALSDVQQVIAAEKNKFTTNETTVTRTVAGGDAFTNGVVGIFAFLKSNQVLYRYEFFNSMKSLTEKVKSASVETAGALNNELNQSLTRHQDVVKSLKFSSELKNEIISKMEDLKNSISVKEIKNHSQIPVHTSPVLARIENGLKQIGTVETIKVPMQSTTQFPNPVYLIGLWSALFALATITNRKNNSSAVAKTTVEEEEKINPTLKRILSDLEYPLFMVDQSLNVVWKNKKTEDLELDTKTIQDILCTRENENANYNFNGRPYNLTFSELAYKSGKTNHLIQCRPQVVSNKHLEHLIDTSEMTALLETVIQKTDNSFGDVNQTVAQLAVKLGYLFKVSGKFLDIDFKKDLSDCFIESERLEKIIKEFIMSCHHMIKDNDATEGIYLRTDETANKFSVSCFLSNYNVETLNSHPMTRDFLKRFSVLEARYAVCNPTIDFKVVNDGHIKGLDITVSFENQSELETIMSNVSASA